MSSTLRTILSSALALLIGALLSGPAFAQATGARGEYFTYRFVPGDILLTLSQRFTQNEENWKTIRKINGIADQYKIPVGFELKIPFSLIDEVPASATISHLRGKAFLNGSPITQTGGQVTEGAVITTDTNSNVTLTLPDDSKVLVPPNSSVTAKRLQRFSGTGYIDAIFTIDRGEVQSHVNPDGGGVGRFEIRTPVSVTGVRGTILRAGTRQGQGDYSTIIKGQADFSQADGVILTRLASNQGVITDGAGQHSGTRALLPPPVLHPMGGQSHNRELRFDPVPGAVAYELVLAEDSEGYDVLWSQRITGTTATLPAVRNGTVYVLVRSLDQQMLAGAQAVLTIEQTMNTINDRQGSPIGVGNGSYLLQSAF
ncbi:FecR family protein [Advenella mimigardefordensis]|uniref:LysM domain-containing protein n=1 Tax=Advenella mimigardefordensis (strain DSM 17166 / LMG 22922 / DPN7) TaxID=1247726 RepID=W0PHU1_ADVMD|nr:FecR domain-containing protein [Advenella mimigardefordensis]AHG66061.1 LysM domain-containing protein [Advenella mimigardefordensis DPN7]